MCAHGVGRWMDVHKVCMCVHMVGVGGWMCGGWVCTWCVCAHGVCAHGGGVGGWAH